MRRGTAAQKDQVNRQKTSAALHHAIDEIQHAARPERPSASGVVSWAVALAAGATVAWRSLRAPRSSAAVEEHVPLGPDAGEPYRPGRISNRRGDIDSHGYATPIPRPDAPFLDTQERGDVDSNGHVTRRDFDSRSEGSDSNDRKNSKKDSKDAAQRARAAEAAKECPARVESPRALLKELWCRFQTAECLTRSQALAFIGVLSLGPVLLFALAALGFVIRDTAQVERFVHDLVGQLLPGRQASDAANSLIAQTHIVESAHTLMKGKWWAVSIGVVSLLWAAVGLFVGASDPMNASWNVKESRGPVKLRAIALGVFLASGVLFLMSLVPSSLPSLVGRLQLPIFGSLKGAWWLDIGAWLLAIVVDAAMFTVIYRFLPNAKVNWKSALVGAAVVGLFWELFKKGFAVYLTHFGDYNKLYGALGGAVLLVTWIWYSCVLLLVGAIVCKMYQEHAVEGGVVMSNPPRKDNRAAPQAAVS